MSRHRQNGLSFVPKKILIYVLREAGVSKQQQVFQLFAHGREYFSLENLLEILVYVLGIINVADDMVSFREASRVSCKTYQKVIGAYALFLSWLNLVIFLRKLPRFGIYIVMFLYVVNTFMQFFIVFTLLIVAFGLAFFIMFSDPPVLPSFTTPVKGMLKTLMMMTGELDFEDIFNNGDSKSGYPWIIYVLFVLLMTIVLMNLLVGLAVDDIQGVQRQAILNRISMQIDLVLDAEKSFPFGMRRWFIAEDKKIYPNHKRGFFQRLRISNEFLSSLDNAIKQEKPLMEQLQGQIQEIDSKSTTLSSRLGKIEEHVDKLSKVESQIAEMSELVKDLHKRS